MTNKQLIKLLRNIACSYTTTDDAKQLAKHLGFSYIKLKGDFTFSRRPIKKSKS